MAYVCMYIKSKREGGERINTGSCCEMYNISICRLMKLGNELRLLAEGVVENTSRVECK